MSSSDIQRLLEEMIHHQKGKLLRVAEKIVPNISLDDLLQPFDYPELEWHPYFRYEEGILQGMESVFAALRAETWITSPEKR